MSRAGAGAWSVAAGALCLATLASTPARAGFTETLPAGTALVDVAYMHSWLNGAYDNDGEFGPLIDRILRYEPGGGLQGVLVPNVKVEYSFLTPQLQLGLLDELTLGIGIPIVLRTTVDPYLDWTVGDYQWSLGRPYSEQDFWEWAASMGQPKPERWVGNEGVLSDIVVGGRLRWTDWLEGLEGTGFASALQVNGALPTGTPADPEEILAAGTTLWEMHAQGDLGFHLGFDYSFGGALDHRLRLGAEGFYEIFFTRSYDTPRGEKHPLLLNYAPYVGDTYDVDPGDFSGFSVMLDVAAIEGPARANWLSGSDPKKAESLPPVLSLWLKYTYTHLQQSDWMSRSALWDWDKEKLWRPGYKNILTGQITFGLLRLGIPALVYVKYRSVTLLPGKNTRAADVLSAGLQVPVPIW